MIEGIARILREHFRRVNMMRNQTAFCRYEYTLSGLVRSPNTRQQVLLFQVSHHLRTPLICVILTGQSSALLGERLLISKVSLRHLRTITVVCALAANIQAVAYRRVSVEVDHGVVAHLVDESMRRQFGQ